MTDIAQLGFAVDTRELKEATAALKAMVPASERTEKAVAALAKAHTDAAVASKRATMAATGATAADRAAAGEAVKKAKAVEAMARADVSAARAADMVAAAVTRQGTASVAAVGKITALTNAANDNINRMQATPANIAAQFQDIGVTAAAGMNPMLIALQQGTQLSAAFAGPNGVKNIIGAIGQLFSPVAMITIALVAMGAALLQMIDWVAVGKSVLNGLADVLVPIAPYAVAAAAGLALINSPAIITGIISLTKAVWGLAASLLATLSFPTLLVLGFVAMAAAAVYFKDQITKILGVDLVDNFKWSVNRMIGLFVGGFNATVKTWSMLPDAMGDVAIRALNFVGNAIVDTLNAAIRGINSLLDMLPSWLGGGAKIEARFETGGDMANPYAGAMQKRDDALFDEIEKAQAVDWVGGAINLVNDGASYLARKLREIASGLGADDKAKKERTARGKTDAEKFGDIVTGAQNDIASVNAAIDGMSMTEAAAMRLKNEQKLLNEAQTKGIKLTDQQRATLMALAGTLTDAQVKLKNLEGMKAIAEASAQRLTGINAEIAALGKNADETTRLRIETDMLAEAKRNMVNVSAGDIATIKATAVAEAERVNTLRKMTEALSFAKETARGFFSDLRNNLEQGKSLWSSFGDAVVGVLNRIIDKLASAAIDNLINQAFGALIGSLGGGMGPIDFGGGAMSFNADGNAFGRGGVMAFASGGVVDRPTAFAFGQGGANLGIMGEAGPEAILPLKRGPDGALGVRMNGNSGDSAGPASNNVEVNNYYTLTGAMSSQDIIAMQRAAAEQTKADVKRSIMGWMDEIQRNGGTV